MHADLLIRNGRVITMDSGLPPAGAIAVRAGRVAAVGAEAQCRSAAPAGAPVLDCRGMTVVPGFVDPHVHLAAFAAAMRAVDCSTARSVDDITRLVRDRAAELPRGEWVRAAGYDESALAEGRHPTRWDLDAAVPDHPVRLLHRSGHALVLNSRAMALTGIDIATEEPPGAVIDRRLADGEPTGLLLDMNDLVGRAVPPLPRADLVAGMRAVSERLLATGVTAVQDMTHTNTPDAARFLTELAAESGFRPRLLAVAQGMPAVSGDGSAPGPAARHTGAVPRPLKIMLREIGGRPVPDVDDLRRIIRDASCHGRQVAVHAIERRSVEAVVTAFERTAGQAWPGALRHRIEHAAVCPPDLAARIAALGLVVVSNPAFLVGGGPRYRRAVAAGDLPHLYAVGALHAAGVTVASASDAPVAPPDPLAAMRAAVGRTDVAGVVLHGRLLPGEAALALHTTAAAFAARADATAGRIAPGMPADFAVLTGDPLAPGTRVARTIIAGDIVWEGAASA